MHPKMSFRFNLGLVPGPESYMKVSCSSNCGDYNDGDGSGGDMGTGDGQGLPALKPNVAIIIIGLGFTLVVVAAFAVFAKFMRPHMNRQNGSGTSRLWEDVIKDGSSVDAKAIKSLPLVVYSAESFQGLNLDLECAVCLSEFEEGEELRLLPSCKHMFHPACIDGWLRSHPFCPLCRSSVLSSSWALHTPPDSTTAGSTFEASMAEEGQLGRLQQSPSREPHVEIPVMERFEARLEALRDKCYGRKGTRSSPAAELVHRGAHASELEKCEVFDVQTMTSTQKEQSSSILNCGNSCDLPTSNALCITVGPADMKDLIAAESCNMPEKVPDIRWSAPRLCGDGILEECSSSSTAAPYASEETLNQNRQR